jgi:hypothetical protein
MRRLIQSDPTSNLPIPRSPHVAPFDLGTIDGV